MALIRGIRRASVGVAAAVSLALAGAALAGTALAGAALAEGAPKVVVTIKPVHALVAAVMAGVGTPALLVEGRASPHTFQLKPSGARAINAADIFFRVGEAVEPFTRRIVEALPPGVRVVTLMDAPGLAILDLRRGATFEAHGHEPGEHGPGQHPDGGRDSGHADDAGDHEHQSAAGGRDGHIWLDPGNARAMVAEIVTVLAERDPGDAERFKSNGAALTAEINALDIELARTLKPLRGRPFIVFHDAYQYLETRYGLDAAGSITVSPDVSPSAHRLAEVREKILALHAACVFVEPQFQGRIVETVAEGTGARLGVLDPEATLLEPGPQLYGQLMRGLATGLTACLEGSN